MMDSSKFVRISTPVTFTVTSEPQVMWAQAYRSETYRVYVTIKEVGSDEEKGLFIDATTLSRILHEKSLKNANRLTGVTTTIGTEEIEITDRNGKKKKIPVYVEVVAAPATSSDAIDPIALLNMPLEKLNNLDATKINALADALPTIFSEVATYTPEQKVKVAALAKAVKARRDSLASAKPASLDDLIGGEVAAPVVAPAAPAAPTAGQKLAKVFQGKAAKVEVTEERKTLPANAGASLDKLFGKL